MLICSMRRIGHTNIIWPLLLSSLKVPVAYLDCVTMPTPQTLFQNAQYVSPNTVRSEIRKKRQATYVDQVEAKKKRTERADGMGLLVEEAKWRLDAMIECDFVAGEQVICFSAHPPISPICRAPLFPTSHILILVF
mgnify:CR=1 FL=1